jgi:hypothetical protein
MMTIANAESVSVLFSDAWAPHLLPILLVAD